MTPNKNTPPSQQRQRSSNLELYRIVCMLMIVAHHYVVNSGLFAEDGPLLQDHTSGNSLFLTLFGAWGKTGINCFLMITGYFMCTSQITLRKFIKLMGQIYLYHWLLYPILLIAGYETLSPIRLLKLAMPVWSFEHNFTSCFVGFWLTIPFLNILIRHMTKRQHELLLLLLLGFYTILGTIPEFNVSFNYVTWFCVIYMIASYIRLYPHPLLNRKQLWGWLTLATVLTAMLSIVGMHILLGHKVAKIAYYFVSDSNRFLAVAIGVTSFLWFKNLDIKYNKFINAFGAGTFGVLLIHANSNGMRQWLWMDTVDTLGHYATLSTTEMAFYSIAVVLTIFIVCNLIDQLRIATLERWFFHWYDNKIAAKADGIINRKLLKI